MNKRYYGIRSAIDQLIENRDHRTYGMPDTSATTIRCALNDLMDYADKSGEYKVNFKFDQERAVRICQNALRR
jgi:hypothetical protein